MTQTQDKKDTEPKKDAVPLRRTAKQIRAAEKRAAREALVAEEAALRDEQLAAAQRLAQVVNLHIAGFSLEAIGASIGASADEVDQMLSKDMGRYVRSQPALRTYVRNFISAKYLALLDTVWDQATDKMHKDMLESQDRAVRILDRMAKLHGAEAPAQAEVTVDAKPEALDQLVQRIAAAQGMGYDTSIFDTVPGEVVHEAAEEAVGALTAASDAVEQPDGSDGL